MFNVGERVAVVEPGTTMHDMPGVIESIDNSGSLLFYFVNVDGYSDTDGARFVNSLVGLDHGYVPFEEQNLRSIES
jgi:hypothetical protein